MLRKSFDSVAQRPEEHQAKTAFFIFLASLAMFFLAGLGAFLSLAWHRGLIGMDLGGLRQIPAALWASLPLMLAVSVLLHYAVMAVEQERQRWFRAALFTAALLAFAFLAMQAWGLFHLARLRTGAGPDDAIATGLAFVLTIIHALHVGGGLAAIGVAVCQALRNEVDHERHWGVELCAYYWHFLDVVWIVMLAAFGVIGA